MLGTVAGTVVMAVAQGLMLRRDLGGIEAGPTPAAALRMLAACGRPCRDGVAGRLDAALGRSLAAQAAAVIVASALDRDVYAAIVWLRVPEARQATPRALADSAAARAAPAPLSAGLVGRHTRTAMSAPAANIRNFSIIAHIDHGKSTLADRILELTGAVDPRDHRPQLLDSMELERERGITIKAQAVRVEYEARDGRTYRLHLIDTPGHVDFTYEVSRSLAACEGALLVVDAAQGVEAQTVANTYLAVDAGLELIPALNKIDLPGAEPERVAREIAELLGESADDVIRVSAKTGEGGPRAARGGRARIPPPQGDADGAPRALIFDSEFDQYRGVVAYVRVVDGELRKGDAGLAMQTGTQADIDEIGFFGPR